MTVIDAANQLADALKQVNGLHVIRIGEAVANTPAVVIGVPSLLWQSQCSDPTEAEWFLAVVVDQNDRAPEVLWTLLPSVIEALEALDDVSVVRADPGVFPDGTADLPCYEIQIGVSL